MPRNLICEFNCGIDMCAIRSWWQKQLHAVFLIRGHYCIVLVCQDSVFLLFKGSVVVYMEHKQPLFKNTCEFASRPGHTKDHHKNGTNFLPA